MYAGLSLVQFILLMIAGMNPIHAVMTALSNTATGGLHHINNGVITSLSVPLKAIITLFAFISSLNATAFINLIHRKWKNLKNSSEAKVYVPYVLGLTLLISFFVIKDGRSTGSAAAVFGSSLMQVISSVSTAGYIVSDVHSWPDASVIILLLMMFIGSCAGSTAGGMKVIRVNMLFKMSRRNILSTSRPRKVDVIRVDRRAIDETIVSQVAQFAVMYVALVFIGAFLVSLDGKFDVLTNITASLTCVSNVGPGLGAVGPIYNFAQYGVWGKVVLSFLMLFGRLELLPMFILFTRSAWKKY